MAPDTSTATAAAAPSDVLTRDLVLDEPIPTRRRGRWFSPPSRRTAGRVAALLGWRAATARATAAEFTDFTLVLANARRRSSNRSSNSVMSSIAKLRSKTAKQSGQSSAGAGGAHVQSARQLSGIESRDVSQGNQGAVLRAHASEGIAEVDVADMGAWIPGGYWR